MSSWVLAPSGRRALAAVWFALFAFLAAGVFFLRPDTKLPALCLYVLLPAIAGAIAGSLWGGAILDVGKTRNPAEAMLRGAAVTAGAFAIFAVLYAFALPLVERGWGMKQAGGILVATLTLGLIMVGPVILIAGLLAGLGLYLLGRRALTAPDRRASDHPTV